MHHNQYLHYRWENNEKCRYYEVIVGMDLFGWIITRIWGKTGTALGKIVHQPCQSFAEGSEQVNIISKHRKRAGYELVSAEGTPIRSQPI